MIASISYADRMRDATRCAIDQLGPCRGRLCQCRIISWDHAEGQSNFDVGDLTLTLVVVLSELVELTLKIDVSDTKLRFNRGQPNNLDYLGQHGRGRRFQRPFGATTMPWTRLHD